MLARGDARSKVAKLPSHQRPRFGTIPPCSRSSCPDRSTTPRLVPKDVRPGRMGLQNARRVVQA